MTLYDELSKIKNIKRHKGEFGVEIETEGLSTYDRPPMALWTVHVDDSLRGPSPYEYVLKTPLMFEGEIPQALDEFKEKIKGIKFDEKSFTTSVHVHVNMLNEQFLTLGNFLTLYCIVENLLKKFAGPTRESNLFCLPLSDAEENYTNIINIIDCIKRRHYGAMEMDINTAKYAALNLCALYKFGSLEIRLLRGTTDTELIHDWMGILYSILQYARQDITPKDIILSWKNKGSELLSDIFGKYRKSLRFPNEEKIIEENFWFAANTAMQVTDWRELDKKPVIKKLASKNLDEISMKVYGTIFESLSEDQKHIIIKNFKYIDPENNINLQGGFVVPGKPKKKVNVVGVNQFLAGLQVQDGVQAPHQPLPGAMQWHPNLEQPNVVMPEFEDDPQDNF